MDSFVNEVSKKNYNCLMVYNLYQTNDFKESIAFFFVNVNVSGLNKSCLFDSWFVVKRTLFCCALFFVSVCSVELFAVVFFSLNC